MLNQEDLKAISKIVKSEIADTIPGMIKKETDPINCRLNAIEYRLKNMEESSREVRSAVNSLIERSDKVSSEIGVRL